MLYTSIDNKFKAQLSKESIQEMLSFIKEKSNETGGIVLGNYNENLEVANIKSVTGPPEDSKSGRTWFFRGIQGLKQLLNKLWQEKIFYLGEWHFHPNANPSASPQDIRQMRKIATTQQYQCPEPILIIIGGNFQKFKIKVFITTSKNKSFFELHNVHDDEAFNN